MLYLLFILKQFTERPQKWASDECFWSQQLLSALMNKLQSVTQWGWCWHILLRWFLYSCQERYLCLFQLSVAQQWYRWSNWPWGPFMANACFSFTLFFSGWCLLMSGLLTNMYWNWIYLLIMLTKNSMWNGQVTGDVSENHVPVTCEYIICEMVFNIWLKFETCFI